MKQNKSKKVILVVIILMVLLIILSGFAYAYFSTDLLKSDKELFFKYVMQTLDNENGLIEKDLITYFNTKKEKAYSNNGRFYAYIEAPKQYMEQLEYTNNMDITFSGKVDNANSKIEQEISINYSDDVKLPFSFKKVNDTIGLMQSKYVSKKYITFNSNQLDDINTNTSLISMNDVKKRIEKVEETSNIEFSNQELEQIRDNYLSIFKEDIPNDAFSSIAQNGKKGYKLKTNSKELNEIVIKMLENLKDDQTTLNKINEYVTIQKKSNKITSDGIDDIIKELKNEAENTDLEITVYQQNGITSKIEINIKDLNLSIEKTKQENDLQYNILIDIFKETEKETLLYFTAKYSGLQEMQNVKESYQLGLEFSIESNENVDSSNNSNSYKYQYNLENEITFAEASNIEDFSKDESFSLSNLEEEKRKNLINTISQRLVAVNKKQMEILGLNENENPIINMIPTAYIYHILGNSVSNEAISEIEEAEISSFNSKFELYEGTNLGGGTVKGLLTVIANNNKLDGDDDETKISYETVSRESLIKEINFNGEEYQVNKQTIALIKGEISTEDYFRVEFEKDEDTGRIYRVVINKK